MLHTPVTSAPKALATCTANVPTPPDAPMTSTFSPGCTFALSRTACSAVRAEIGTAAACSNDRFAGLGASRSARATANSAKEPPLQTPYTSSPGENPVTSLPTDSTVPATLRPGLSPLGRRRPKPATRIG